MKNVSPAPYLSIFNSQAAHSEKLKAAWATMTLEEKGARSEAAKAAWAALTPEEKAGWAAMTK